MNIVKKSTWLPLFPGFYETWLKPDEVISDCTSDIVSDIACTEDVPYDLVLEYAERNSSFDNAQYERSAAVAYCKEIQRLLRELFKYPVEIEFEHIVSPREYNFRNDSVNCTITLDTEEVLDYCRKYCTEFSTYLKANYTSYDGFISFRSNRIEDWLDDEEWDDHQIGAVLQFCLVDDSGKDLHDLEAELSLRVLETVDASEFLNLDKVRLFFQRDDVRELCANYERDLNTGEAYVACMKATRPDICASYSDRKRDLLDAYLMDLKCLEDMDYEEDRSICL